MNRLLIFLALALSALASPPQQMLLAAKPAASGTAFITTNPTGSTRNDYSGVVGFGYTETAVRNVTKLGRWIVAGNSHTHVLTLQDTTAGTVLATATIDASLFSGGDYGYVSVTPANTIIGHDYVIVSTEVSGLDSWYDFQAYSIVSGPTNWGTTTNLVGYLNNQHAYVPPNFLFN